MIVNAETAPLHNLGMTSNRTRERLVARLGRHGIHRADVLAAIKDTPRHWFVDEALAGRAYEDTALPLGFGQTISQPYVVALMTQALLDHGATGKILEIGTGCGYQTSVLARCVKHIVSVERLRGLLVRARAVLKRQHIANVLTVHGDGFHGWPAEGPYDGIMVTAAPKQLPNALLQQLSATGVLVLPVGPAGNQKLVRICRDGEGFHSVDLGAVSFVPLVKGVR